MAFTQEQKRKHILELQKYLFAISIVNEKEEGELPEMLKDLTKEQVVWGAFLTFLIFW